MFSKFEDFVERNKNPMAVICIAFILVSLTAIYMLIPNVINIGNYNEIIQEYGSNSNSANDVFSTESTTVASEDEQRAALNAQIEDLQAKITTGDEIQDKLTKITQDLFLARRATADKTIAELKESLKKYVTQKCYDDFFDDFYDVDKQYTPAAYFLNDLYFSLSDDKYEGFLTYSQSGNTYHSVMTYVEVDGEWLVDSYTPFNM